MNKAKPYSDKILNDHGPQRTFSGSDLLQIALPIGGLGAGNVCLNGHGGLQDFAIRNQPATTAMPDAHARAGTKGCRDLPTPLSKANIPMATSHSPIPTCLCA
jgi:hypothetical protein